MGMDNALLRTFLTLYETKNFTNAARKLHRTQSAISLQVARLEELVGKQLFKRDNRHVLLTPEGEQLVGYARRMLKLENDLLKSFQEEEVSGSVSFGIPEDIATTYLPKILANFVEDHPSILLHVNCEFTLNLLQRYEAGDHDLVLIKQDPDHPHPSSREFWREPLVWVCSSKISAVEFDRPIPLILAPSPCVYRKRAIDALDEADIDWRIVYTSPSLTGTIAAVKAGLGISVLPLKMIPKGLQVLKHLPPLQDAQIALLQPEKPSPAAQAFAEYISEQMLPEQ